MKTLLRFRSLRFPALAFASLALLSCETVDKGQEKWDDMSDKDRATVIGGVGGAVVGAAVSGSKAAGAIVGGAAGAVGGRIWSENRNDD